MNNENLEPPVACNESVAINHVAPRPTLEELLKNSNTKFGLFKLPEWKGFWIKAGQEVFVFTKDLQLLNTPDYEQFGSRLDWENVRFGTDESNIETEFVKVIRKRIDLITKKIDLLLSPSRAKSLSITSLETAFMWLGLELGAIGSPNPYPKSMDSSSPVIEKAADKADQETNLLFEALGGLDETGVTKALRLEVQRTIDIIRSYFATENRKRKFLDGSYPINMAVDRDLINGKLWLGQQLNHILIQQEKNPDSN